MQQPKSLSSSRAEYDNTVAAHLVSLLSELLWLFVVSIVVVVATLTLATFGALAPLSWTTLWQILLQFVGLLKLPTNCPTTLPTRCLRQQQEEAVPHEEGKRKEKAKQNNNRGSVLISFFIQSER